MREQMHEAISAIPTRAEFDSALASTGNTTVGGMSGLTYSMMKAWPEEVTDYMFHSLLQIRESKVVPDFWKWRWMCPKPKVTENITLADLRPLVLVEVSRKLWTSIIVSRIKHQWERNDLLHHNQHRFRAGHGTCTATIQLIDALETARANAAEIYISSWDMKRAFDSVARNILIASWIRLGIPEPEAQWLVDMDVDGKTVIRSPLAQYAWSKSKYAGFEDLRDQLHAMGPGNNDCTAKPSYFSCDARAM